MLIKALGATMTAVALLLAAAACAQATVVLQVGGNTLTVTGGAGADAPRLTYYNSVDPQSNPGYTRIFDDGGVNDPLPAACARLADPEGQIPAKVVFCQDGGNAPSLFNVVMALGGGADQPDFGECFDTVVVDAGEGANRIVAPACPTGTFGVTSGAGQDQVSVQASDPNAAPALIAVTADLGAGDDTFFGGDGATVVHGGPGNDYLVGGNGNDQLFGDDGADTFLGRGGDDRYDGGAGDDTFGLTKGVSNDDDQGNDDYRGGPGSDLLVLDGHNSGMTISIDEAANDGSSGEADNIHNDIERIRGTNKNDVFTGGPGVDAFEGNAGDDTIHGGGGDDDLYGGGGDDKVYGDAGNDKLQGANGSDTVDGGTGTDALYGDIGSCSFSCSFDADVLLARDGERDTVDCGGGADTAQVDALDVVAFCASIDRSAAGGGAAPPPPAAPGGTTATFTFVTGATPTIAKGAVATVTCPAACSFTVSLVLSAKTARRYGLGRQSFTAGTARGALLAAGSKKVAVKLSTKAKRKLRRGRKVPTTLEVTVKDAAGKSTTKSRAITLRR